MATSLDRFGFVFCDVCLRYALSMPVRSSVGVFAYLTKTLVSCTRAIVLPKIINRKLFFATGTPKMRPTIIDFVFSLFKPSMSFCVFRCSQHFKVIERVVKRIAVFMVNMLFSFEIPVQMFLHYMTMLKNIFIVNPEPFVASGVDVIAFKPVSHNNIIVNASSHFKE